MDQTIPYPTMYPLAQKAVLIQLAVIVCGIGTGGICTREYAREYARVHADGAAFVPYRDQATYAATSVASPTTAVELDAIKSTLGLSVKDLAKVLGVSRQAIYDWKSGAPIKAGNLSKLSNLKAAADVIAGSQWKLSPLAFTRKLPGGQTLFERIGSGRNGTEAAQALVAMLKREAEQQKLLSQKVAGLATTHSSGKGVQSFDDWA